MDEDELVNKIVEALKEVMTPSQPDKPADPTVSDDVDLSEKLDHISQQIEEITLNDSSSEVKDNKPKESEEPKDDEDPEEMEEGELFGERLGAACQAMGGKRVDVWTRGTVRVAMVRIGHSPPAPFSRYMACSHYSVETLLYAPHLWRNEIIRERLRKGCRGLHVVVL